MNPAARAASPTRTAPATTGVGRLGPASWRPTAATGGNDASANAPSGPPEIRSETSAPRKAHQTPSRAPAATDQEAATNIGSDGRAPPKAISGATVPGRGAAGNGTTMPNRR